MKALQKRTVAIVTGGRSGIGRKTAETLVSMGVMVYVPGRKPFEAEGMVYLPSDVTCEQDVQRAVAEVYEKEQQIDILVNCAGFGILSATEFTPAEDAKKQMDVNFFGMVNMTKAVLSVMRKQRYGRIVNVSSMAAPAALPFQNYYSASKAAVNAYTDALRNEVRPYGISCCCVLPGDIRTGFTDARKSILDGDEFYEGRITAGMEKQAKYEREGADPSIAGEKIAKICLRKRIRGIYTVDAVSAVEYALIKILPHDLSNKAIGKLYGEWRKKSNG